MKLSVHLVTWNGAKYIPYLFASLRAQTFRDWSLVVLDNDSKDDTVLLIEKELANWSGDKKFIKNSFLKAQDSTREIWDLDLFLGNRFVT